MMPSIFEFLTPEQAAGIVKAAENKEIRHPVAHAAGTVAKGLAGFGLGTAGGFAFGALADAVYKKTTGENIPGHFLVPAASLLGAGMGVAYSLYKAKELEELRRAFEAHRNKSQGGVSR